SASSVKGTEILAQNFGPGYVAPIQIVVQGRSGAVFRTAFLRGIQSLTARIRSDPRVASVQSLASVAQSAGISASSFSQLTAGQLSSNPALAGAAGKVVNLGGGSSTTLLNVIPRYSE